ncbi:MAG TPA: histidine phosphotransferase family protein, partial [Stellaceae bacterium]|nr:histidine phosphotransferase family protein [Stellaceae bacterium]
EGLPRGGRLIVDAGAAELFVEGVGEAAGLAPEARAAMELATPVAELASRTVHAYFTGVLARSLGSRLVDVPGGEGGFRVIAAAV